MDATRPVRLGGPRAHPRWGARRISCELGRDGRLGPVPSRTALFCPPSIRFCRQMSARRSRWRRPGRHPC